MSYPPLPVPPSTTKSHPHQPTHFITHRRPLLLILSFAFLLTLTILLLLLLLLLPITGPLLLGTARSCPNPPHQSLGQQQQQQPHPYILSSFREDPLNEASSSQTQKDNEKEKDPWEATLIPPSSGGGIFATHLDVLTEANVQRVDPNRTHSGILDRSYGIAMFHQLHCMGALRGKVFPDAVHGHGQSGSSDGERGSESEKEKHIKEHDHLQHCFNYILQSILCSASDTIERPKHITPHGKPMWHIDGIGDVHRCRDAKVLWTVSEQSLLNPVDMRSWKGEEGVGVREFFG